MNELQFCIAEQNFYGVQVMSCLSYTPYFGASRLFHSSVWIAEKVLSLGLDGSIVFSYLPSHFVVSYLRLEKLSSSSGFYFFHCNIRQLE